MEGEGDRRLGSSLLNREDLLGPHLPMLDLLRALPLGCMSVMVVKDDAHLGWKASGRGPASIGDCGSPE